MTMTCVIGELEPVYDMAGALVGTVSELLLPLQAASAIAASAAVAYVRMRICSTGRGAYL